MDFRADVMPDVMPDQTIRLSSENAAPPHVRQGSFGQGVQPPALEMADLLNAARDARDVWGMHMLEFPAKYPRYDPVPITTAVTVVSEPETQRPEYPARLGLPSRHGGEEGSSGTVHRGSMREMSPALSEICPCPTGTSPCPTSTGTGPESRFTFPSPVTVSSSILTDSLVGQRPCEPTLPMSAPAPSPDVPAPNLSAPDVPAPGVPTPTKSPPRGCQSAHSCVQTSVFAAVLGIAIALAVYFAFNRSEQQRHQNDSASTAVDDSMSRALDNVSEATTLHTSTPSPPGICNLSQTPSLKLFPPSNTFSHRLWQIKPITINGQRHANKENDTLKWKCPCQYTLGSEVSGLQSITCERGRTGSLQWSIDDVIGCFEEYHVCEKNQILHPSRTTTVEAILQPMQQHPYQVNDVVQVSCPPNYTAVIHNSKFPNNFPTPFEGGQLRCRYPGVWHPQGIISCVPAKAENPYQDQPEPRRKCRQRSFMQRLIAETVQRGKMRYSCYKHSGKACLFQCADGYHVENGPRAWTWKCTIDDASGKAEWSYAGRSGRGVFTCSPRKCSDPRTIVGGNRSQLTVSLPHHGNSYLYGDIADLRCNGTWANEPATAGMHQLLQVRCQANGAWSRSKLVCVPHRKPCSDTKCGVECGSWFSNASGVVAQTFTILTHGAETPITGSMCRARGSHLDFGDANLMSLACNSSRSPQECSRLPFSVPQLFKCNIGTCSMQDIATGEVLDSVLSSRAAACMSAPVGTGVDGLLKVGGDEYSLMNGTVVHYRCRPGYLLDEGHSGAVTCINGLWSPLPKCFAEEQCDLARPAFKYFGDYPSCRTVPRSQHGVTYLAEVCETRCRRGALGNRQHETWSLSCQRQPNGSYAWTNPAITCQEGCLPPPQLPVGSSRSVLCSNSSHRCQQLPAQYLPPGTEVVYTCPGGWVSRASTNFSTFCIGGYWTETSTMPECRVCQTCKLKSKWINSRSLYKLHAPFVGHALQPGHRITVSCAKGRGDLERRRKCYNRHWRQGGSEQQQQQQQQLLSSERWREGPVTFECECEPKKRLRIVSPTRGLRCKVLPRRLRRLRNHRGSCSH